VTGVARLELLHRLRQAVASPPEAGGQASSSPSSSSSSATSLLLKDRRSPTKRGREALIRSSWPAGPVEDGGGCGTRLLPRHTAHGQGLSQWLRLVHPHVLAVLTSCPPSIPRQVCAKLLEVVCKYSLDQVHTVLHHVDKVLRHHMEAGTDTVWPEFGLEPEHGAATIGALGAQQYPAAEDKSLAGAQAISIFRALDADASGSLTEASLVRGLSSWLASTHTMPYDQMPDKTQPPADADAARKSEGATLPNRLAAVPEEADSASASSHILIGACLPGVEAPSNGTESAATVAASAATVADSGGAVASVAAAAGVVMYSAAPSLAITAERARREPPLSTNVTAGPLVMKVRVIEVGSKAHDSMDKVIAEKLKALRQQDVECLDSKLKHVTDAHTEASARIARVLQVLCVCCAVCCSALRRAAMCHSVLQCIAQSDARMHPIPAYKLRQHTQAF